MQGLPTTSLESPSDGWSCRGQESGGSGHHGAGHGRCAQCRLVHRGGPAEIGGGYLVWRWLREGAPWPVGLLGDLTLVANGVGPTLQHADFGRVYSAYGGVFVFMSLLWGWGIDGHRPDTSDWAGATVIARGVAVIFFAPRH